MRLILSLIFFSWSGLNSFAQINSPVLDPEKFTICAITINSDDEKKLFETEVKKYPHHFNPIVELTDLAQADWFDKACASGIRCDQLIISGHFGGSFFGSSGRSLPLDLLEKKGCSKSCEGILNHPFEVFLFGCNTLAGKDQDHRPPEQYLQVLLADGIPRAEAELVVESRYGAIGGDIKSKMQRAFAGENKQLYGFDSVGPSGKTIKNYLKNYLRKINLKKHLEKKRASRLLGKVDQANTTLAESLKSTNFTQCNVDIGKSDEVRRIACGLQDEGRSVDNKLALVTEALSQEIYLAFIPSINNFFKAHPVDEMTPDQKQMVAELSSNKVIKGQVLNLIKMTKSPSLSMEWIQFATSLALISEDESSILVQNKVEGLFKKPLTISDKDWLCSTQFSRNPQISAASIGARKLNQFDIETLGCLGGEDVQLHAKIAEYLKDVIPEVRVAAAKALWQIDPQDKDVLMRLTDALKDSDPSVRNAAAESLGAIKPQDKDVLMRVTEVLKDANPEVRATAAWTLYKIKPQDKEISMRLTDALKDSDPSCRISNMGTRRFPERGPARTSVGQLMWS